jgi:predicted dehydrogenase
VSGRHILVVGAGSVGRRHAGNLAALGCRIAAVDPRADRRQEIEGAVAAYPTLAEALAAGGFDAAAVCSPNAFHVEQALAALDAGLPVLLEKPAATDLAGAARLAARLRAPAAPPLLLGYTWRWWPPLARLRELLAAGAVGRIRHVQMVMSAHLADWHPWEPLADFFMSDASLGGGALLDESHWIDLLLWLFGMPADLAGDVDRISGLEITADDNVDILLRYPDGMRAHIHLDLYGRPHRKSIRCVGEAGTLLWSESPNRIAVGRHAEAHWEEEMFSCARNDMFMAVAQAFLRVLDGAPPACGIDDGLKVMRVIEAVRQSGAQGRRVALA